MRVQVVDSLSQAEFARIAPLPSWPVYPTNRLDVIFENDSATHLYLSAALIFPIRLNH
jgi:hypothetical protein